MTLVAVRDGETFTPDDGDTVLGTVSLGNGYTVYASGPVYPYVIPQTVNGHTQNPVSTYPIDTAIELVELTTGNRYTYSQIKTTWSVKTARPTPRPNSRPTASPRFSCRASKPRTSWPEDSRPTPHP